MKKILVILFLACLVFSGSAHAAPPLSYSDSMGRLNTFMKNVDAVLNNILADPSLSGFVNALWNTLTIVLIVTVLAKYSMTGISTFELIHPLLLILITRLMLNHYDYLTGLFWDWSEGIAGGIQRAVIGNSDPFLLPGFVNDVVSGIQTSGVSIWDGVNLLMASTVILAIISLLSLMAFFASTWALWGYALAKIIGWFFIPFIMFKRLSFLFDGWMRLFLGFLVYGIIARANLLLTVLAVKSYFAVPGYAVNTNTSIRLDFNGIADLFGMIAFLFIAILALIATGRFATVVVSGVSGFGQSISTLAYGLARVMRGF